MSTGDIVLRVLRHAETGATFEGFYCASLRCSLTAERCARRHAIAKIQTDNVEVTAVGASTSLSEGHICASCPIGEAHLSIHGHQDGPRRKTRQRVRLVARDRTAKRLPVNVGDTIGIYSVLAKDGVRTQLRCDRCGHVRWSGHKDRKGLEAVRCCRKCPRDVRRSVGVSWAQPKSITEETAAKLMEMFRAGSPRREIAIALNVSATSVRNYLIRVGAIKGPIGAVVLPPPSEEPKDRR